MKSRIKRTIAFVLALIIFWQVIPADILETFATQDPKLYLTIVENGVPVDGFNIEATISVSVSDSNLEIPVTFQYDSEVGKYVAEQSVVSENEVSCNIKISKAGYDTYADVVTLKYNSATSGYESDVINMYSLHNFTVSGNIKKYRADETEDNFPANARVAVNVYKWLDATEQLGDWVDKYESDNNGEYIFLLKPGKYVFEYSKPDLNYPYITEKKVVEVTQDKRIDTLIMYHPYMLQLTQSGPEEAGTVKVSVENGAGMNFKGNGLYEIKEGTEIKITASPENGYRLTDDQENVMTSNVENGKLDDGSTYYVKFHTDNLKRYETYPYTVNFETEVRPVIKYDGENIYYCRQGKNATVSVNTIVSENKGKFTITCDKGYYVSNVGNSTLAIVSSNELSKTYKFESNDQQIAKIGISGDETPPDLEIAVSDNNILWGYVEEDGKYVKAEKDGQNYWYINSNKTIYANATDGETGIRDVAWALDDEPFLVFDYLTGSKYSTQIRYVLIKEKGSQLILKAEDNADNEKRINIKAYYDNAAPSVSENLVISENTIQYFQNGERFVGAKSVDFVASITDDGGIRNIYYLITEEKIDSEEALIKKYNEGEFTTISQNIVTSKALDVELTADFNNKKAERLYAYVIADDFALNMDFNKVGKSNFKMDADAPTISNLKDISAHNSRYKRDTDEIKLSATFTDDLTPSGMKYHVTTPQKLPANADLTKIKSPDSEWDNAKWESLEWTAFGDENETKRSYENVTMTVSNNLAPGSYVVWVYAKDGCENVSEGKQYVFHIDNQKPNMTTLAFDVKEDGNPFFDWLMKIGNFFRKDATKVPNQKNDRAQTVTIKLKADDKEPTDDIYALGTNTGLESVEIYFVSGEKQEYYETCKDSIESKTQREMPEFTHTAKLIEKDEINGEYTYELNLPKGEVFYRLMAVAKDYAGNCNYLIPTSNEAYKSDLVMLDQVLPTIEMNLTSPFATPDYKSGNKFWYSENKKVTYDVQIKDTGAGLFQARYTINDKEYAKNLYVTDSTTDITSNDKKQLTVNKDAVNKSSGKVTFHAEVQDNAGNMAELEKSVYIDVDEPVIKEVVFADKFTDDLKVVPTQYGFFFRDKTTVEVKVTDYIGKTKNLGSGVKKVTYYLLDCENKMTPEKSISLTKNKDNVYTGKFVVPKGFKGQIYLNAEDNTGQATGYKSPKGTVIEGAAEHATHSKAEIKLPETSYTDEEGNPLYNHLPTIQYITKDTKSGILQNVWSVKPFHLGSNEAEGVLDVTSNYDEAKGKFDPVLSGDIDWTVSKKLDLNLVTTANRTYSVKNQMNHIQAELQLTDNAGNKTKKEIKVFSVDTTNPEIEVEYDNNDVQNEKYYKEPRVATITVKERNFSTEGVEMIITGDGAKIGEWQHHAGGGCDGTVHTDECTNVCNVTFDEDEEYTFTINCTDRAGNEGSYGQVDEFVIDLTNPVIQVTYDNNDARNGSYYKEARTATISIEETNFDEERTLPTITAKLQDTPIEAPVVSAFTTVEDMNTATVTYDKDGDYTFNIEVTDLAGNEADIFVQESFTIDMTAPELVVEGVEDGSANKDVVQPIITYTDVNMDEESVDIILTGANLGKVDFGKVETKVENGKKIDLGDFKHEQEVDDLYTLETVIIDMAGNEVTDTRTFSVNRFGSVYVYDDDTKDLMDDFYTNKEKDLVITEINVDTLEFVEIDSSIDGEITTLEEGKDYEVKKAYTDKQWRAYEYHIPATNFEKEGAYVVTIYSEDRAENKSSNKAKGKELNFVVDKTAPTIVVGGIEDGGQYREANREITLDVEDNVLLKTVDVYVNGAIVKTVAQEELLTENGRIKVNLKGSNKKQVLTVQSKDAAGNHAESKAVSFLITPNIFVQWYTNKPIFIGSILVMAGAVGFLFFRRRKITVPQGNTTA